MAPAFHFTRRETQVVEMIAEQGFSYTEIGARLGISPRNVGKHLHRIYRKMGFPKFNGRGQQQLRLVIWYWRRRCDLVSSS